MTTRHPISTSPRSTNCQSSWESAAVGVEFLFMGGSRLACLGTEISDDRLDDEYFVLNPAHKLNLSSGRYRQTVPK